MTVPDELHPLVRAALYRKGLADARQRAALARRLGLTDSEVLAVQHLARAGELTPGKLGGLLQLSSGGTTGLIQRLQRAGHVSRHANCRDRRSVVVRLTPAIAAWAADAWAPFVAEIAALVAELSDTDRDVVRASSRAPPKRPNATPTASPETLTLRPTTPWPYPCPRCGRRNSLRVPPAHERDVCLN
jgi:DNA-binding MarR family transcriptional regulator